jgi:hypothetical protein
MTDDQNENPEPQRDGRGRYVKGVSGNPAGKPAGIMNEATRVAAMLLTGSTPVLVHKTIELALMGKTAPLKYCLDRIIAPQRDQPVVFETSLEGDGPPDLAGAMELIAAAAAEGTINPSQAATLCQAFADHARGIETRERTKAQQTVADAPAIWNRFELRICVALADGVREIRDEGGEVDDNIPPLCAPILRIGRQALVQLAIIGDRAELILADEAFVYQHPHRPDDVPLNPLAAEILPHWQELEAYLNRNMDSLDEKAEERFAAREAAGEPDPIYRSWIFQPIEVRAARFARST